MTIMGQPRGKRLSVSTLVVGLVVLLVAGKELSDLLSLFQLATPYAVKNSGWSECWKLSKAMKNGAPRPSQHGAPWKPIQ